MIKTLRTEHKAWYNTAAPQSGEVCLLIFPDLFEVVQFGKVLILRKYQLSNISRKRRLKLSLDLFGKCTLVGNPPSVSLLVFPVLRIKSAPIFVFLAISTNKNYHGIERNQKQFLGKF